MYGRSDSEAGGDDDDEEFPVLLVVIVVCAAVVVAGAASAAAVLYAKSAGSARIAPTLVKVQPSPVKAAQAPAPAVKPGRSLFGAKSARVAPEGVAPTSEAPAPAGN